MYMDVYIDDFGEDVDYKEVAATTGPNNRRLCLCKFAIRNKYSAFAC